MPDDLKGDQVFIASPGGLSDVRKSFREAIVECNEGDAIHRRAVFIPVRWEDTLPGVGRAQSLINEDVRKCDYFVLVLWNRWGTPPDNEGHYTSGTEEENNVAMECMKDLKRPMRQIVVLFRGVDPQQLSYPGDQLKKVLEFKKRLDTEKKLLWGTLDSVNEFEKLLRKQLSPWLLDHERGNTAKPTQPVPGPVLPLVVTDTAGLLGISSKEEKELADQPNSLLDKAEHLAQEGRLTEAETAFAALVVRGNDPDAFNRYGKFLWRLGRLDHAEVMFRRVIELSEQSGDNAGVAKGYGNLGLIYLTRGELDRAEEMLKKALAIEKKLGRQEGTAIQYSNLGSIARDRGDIGRARELWIQARDLLAKIGMPHRVETVQGWLDGLPPEG